MVTGWQYPWYDIYNLYYCLPPEDYVGEQDDHVENVDRSTVHKDDLSDHHGALPDDEVTSEEISKKKLNY